jgi:2-oxoglutarate ferredoxin oxidoreductase subunit alpha
VPYREINLLIGGPQGSGIETTVYVLTTAFTVAGYGVASEREYHSNIIGRHSYMLLRVNAHEIPKAFTYPVDIAAAIDAETVFTHFEDVKSGGVFIYDTNTENVKLETVISMDPARRERLIKYLDNLGVGHTVADIVKLMESRGVKPIGIDYKSLVSELESKFGVPRRLLQRFTNSIIAGAIAALSGLDVEDVRAGFERRFRGREHVIEPNMYVVERAKSIVESKVGRLFELEEGSLPYDEVLIASGNEIVAMAKAVAGLRFQSYYPITPAQDESFYLENYEILDDGEKRIGSIVVFQTEDEIAAIAAAIGAALAGARAATATSGPGFDLMAEGLSCAGMCEAPIVITLYQRGGPSTGMPTRGSQSDLMAALFAGHGEFPRIVIASGDHLEAFYDTVKAFNLAEKYQLPVIHLLDKFIANNVVVVPIPDIDSLRIDRGKLIMSWDRDEEYKRFNLSEGLISTRVPFGGAVMWYTSDEHNEEGHITEDPELRIAMETRRNGRIELADKEIPEEGERAMLYGGDDYDFLLVGWGSVKGAAVEAVEKLRSEGYKVSYLHIRYFQPFPSRYVGKLIERVGVQNVATVEHNYHGLAGKVVAMNTGFLISKKILKFTGRPIYVHELVDAVKKVVEGVESRVVLKYGA